MRITSLLYSFRALLLTCTIAAIACAENTMPNVVIIYGDDVGYGDVGAYGSEKIPTPNIDKLAAGGMRFTDGHCSAATCTPSRYSMLTGIHGFRNKISILPPDAALLIPTDILTLPKLFKQAGYTTGVVGKWHLGLGTKGEKTDWNGDVKPGPLEIGFDYSFLLPSTNDRVPCVYLDGHRVVNLDPNDPLFVGNWKEIQTKTQSTQYPNGKTNPEAMTYYPSTHGHNHSVINGIGRIGYMAGGKSALWDDETMADVFVEKAVKYIEEKKDEPFFLYFASQDIHVPRAPHPRFQGKTDVGYRGNAMVQFDWTTGEIMKALDKHGLTENTIVIFSSDNGPVYDDGYADGTTVKTSREESDGGHDGSGIFRGGKYQIYEGGTRVPFIIRWPAKIKPGVSDALVNQIDFMASFASLLGYQLADDEASDSRDTLATFLGQKDTGLSVMIEEAKRVNALRMAEWKYIPKQKKSKKAELYNLAQDPGEQNNLVDKFPEKAEMMDAELNRLVNVQGIREAL